MNLIVTSIVFDLWSYRKELSYVCLAFLIILSLPFLALVTITNVGVKEVSESLVRVDSKTNTIKLFYPNGELYKELSLNITMPVKGQITNEFGTAVFPYYLFHSGIDIASNTGDPITPFLAGKVTYADEIFWGYGKHVIIDHGDNITSLYGHLDTINVKEGDEVKPGKVIGTEGSTGWSTGAHLHFEIRVFGIPVNPTVFF